MLAAGGVVFIQRRGEGTPAPVQDRLQLHVHEVTVQDVGFLGEQAVQVGNRADVIAGQAGQPAKVVGVIGSIGHARIRQAGAHS